MSDHPGVLAALEKLQNGATTLNLEGKKIGPEGAKAVAAALKENRSLTSLDLYNNNIGSDGAKAVGAALKENRSLTSLDLQNNRIGSEGAKAAAAALKENWSLTSLNLTLSHEGERELDLNEEIYYAKIRRTRLEQISRELGCIHAVNNALSMPSSVKLSRSGQSLLASSNGEQSSKEEFLATQKVELDILEALIVAFSESLRLLGPYIFE